jgi:predicted ATP-grasp superfamily ATP-dependent carboligase
MQLYGSRLKEMHEEYGEYTENDAAAHFAHYLMGQSTDNMLELRYTDRRRVHNLKYYTWVEQQGKTYEEILEQWYQPNYWTDVQKQVPEIDALIEEFIDGRDISISVVGSHNRLFTLPPSECIYLNSSKERILTYDSKWIAESHDYRITEVQCPIYLAPGLEQTLRRTSLLAFEVMGCRDYARMDFRVRGDSPYLLEVNPNPCLHPEEAGFTRSWKATGKSFNQLIYQILQSSYENYQS